MPRLVAVVLVVVTLVGVMDVPMVLVSVALVWVEDVAGLVAVVLVVVTLVGVMDVPVVLVSVALVGIVVGSCHVGPARPVSSAVTALHL